MAIQVILCLSYASLYFGITLVGTQCICDLRGYAIYCR